MEQNKNTIPTTEKNNVVLIFPNERIAGNFRMDFLGLYLSDQCHAEHATHNQCIIVITARPRLGEAIKNDVEMVATRYMQQVRELFCEHGALHKWASYLSDPIHKNIDSDNMKEIRYSVGSYTLLTTGQDPDGYTGWPILIKISGSHKDPLFHVQTGVFNPDRTMKYQVVVLNEKEMIHSYPNLLPKKELISA